MVFITRLILQASMKTTKPLYFILMLFAINSLIGQNEDFVHFSSWNKLSIKANLSKKVFLKNEFNFRRTNFLKDWEQIVLRPSVQYKIENQLSISIGYSFIHNYSYSDFSLPIDFKENNLWQQLFVKQTFKYFDISHRIRFEERFKEKVSTIYNSSFIEIPEYSGRLRYRFILTIPLHQKQRISAVMYDEVFLDFEQNLEPKKLDQNWMFVGLSFRNSKHITITSGYHYINIPREHTKIKNHIWETSLIYTL